jgi:hypothetical protein
MSLRKNHPKYSPSRFLSKLKQCFILGKKSENLGYFCNFQNICSKKTIALQGKYSPNLVTLIDGIKNGSPDDGATFCLALCGQVLLKDQKNAPSNTDRFGNTIF